MAPVLDMYKVIKYFTDLQDNSRPYNVGDTYPRKGLTVSEARIKELMGSNNLQNTPLIEEIVTKAKPKNKANAEEPKDTAEVNVEEAAEELVEEPKKTTRRKRK